MAQQLRELSSLEPLVTRDVRKDLSDVRSPDFPCGVNLSTRTWRRVIRLLSVHVSESSSWVIGLITAPSSSRKDLRLLLCVTYCPMADENRKLLVGQPFLGLDAKKRKHLDWITKPMESSRNVQSWCHLKIVSFIWWFNYHICQLHFFKSVITILDAFGWSLND